MKKKSKAFRVERDFLGEIQVPKKCLWGAQTQRSIHFFKIGSETFHPIFISSYALLKKAAAKANAQLGLLAPAKAKAIVRAASEVEASRWHSQFPVSIFQTGSGTQFHMNMNEVIANRAQQLSKATIHPNDDVNRSQSTNDTFPTVMHLSTWFLLHDKLFPSLLRTLTVFSDLKDNFKHVLKIGRTHHQDAVPLTLGQEISGWEAQIHDCYRSLLSSLPSLEHLALGGTAVGTGLNAPKRFSIITIQEINRATRGRFKQGPNLFAALSAHDGLAEISGKLRTLAGALYKIASDIRWMSSGPHAGLSEIFIPKNEPGSSIMPGKTNPTQAEALSMVVAQVYGNDATIAFAASQGVFELNTFKPIIIHRLLNSIDLLADAINSFSEHCLSGLRPNLDQLKQYLDQSLMLATALTPIIGYERAAELVQYAQHNKMTLKQAAEERGLEKVLARALRQIFSR